MSDKILTICVPTYNRCELLESTIETILFAIKQSGSDSIEIIISDNASTDDTPKTISKIVEKYPFIRHRRNKVNVVDKNFFIVADAADGEYVWVFGDDDHMEPDAVQKILSAINEGNSLIILNYSLWNNKFDKLTQKTKYNFPSDLEFENANKILETFSIQLQFITGVVIKKDLFFAERKYDYLLLMEFGNPFLYAVYVGIRKDCKAKYISKTLVKYRGGNTKGFNLEQEKVITKWYRMFIYGNNFFLKLLKNEGYNLISIRRARFGIIKEYLLPDIIFRKKDGYNSLRLLKKIPAVYFSHPSFILVGIPLIFTPNYIIKKLYNWYRNKKLSI